MHPAKNVPASDRVDDINRAVQNFCCSKQLPQPHEYSSGCRRVFPGMAESGLYTSRRKVTWKVITDGSECVHWLLVQFPVAWCEVFSSSEAISTTSLKCNSTWQSSVPYTRILRALGQQLPSVPTFTGNRPEGPSSGYRAAAVVSKFSLNILDSQFLDSLSLSEKICWPLA